jgi:hypothetical protein
MLLWILLSSGLTLGAVAGACLLATTRAERRARRNLYSSLGLSDELISVLMRRKGPVSVQLALVRQASVSGGIRLEDFQRAEGRQVATQRSFRFPSNSHGAHPVGSDRRTLAPARRNRPPGRDPA